MKITQEIREFADKGMFDMSEKFKAGGSEIYHPTDEVAAEKAKDAAE